MKYYKIPILAFIIINILLALSAFLFGHGSYQVVSFSSTMGWLAALAFAIALLRVEKAAVKYREMLFAKIDVKIMEAEEGAKLIKKLKEDGKI